MTYLRRQIRYFNNKMKKIEKINNMNESPSPKQS